MKKLLAIIILSLCFITPSQADDIRDFQIEGMSVGESLLKYMTESEIKNSKRNYQKGKKRYYVVYTLKNINAYDVVDIYLKTGDKNYEIKTVGGLITTHNKKDCLKKRKEIVNELREIFEDSKLVEYENTKHHFDKSGKSRTYQSAFLLKNDNNKDHVRVECSFWSKKMKKKNKFVDNLNVVAYSSEILNWFADGYN